MSRPLTVRISHDPVLSIAVGVASGGGRGGRCRRRIRLTLEAAGSAVFLEALGVGSNGIAAPVPGDGVREVPARLSMLLAAGKRLWMDLPVEHLYDLR